MARTDDPFPLIKRLRSMGMPDTVVFNRLVIEGWAESDIKHAFEGKAQDPAATALASAAPRASAPVQIPAPVSRTAATFFAGLSPLALIVTFVAVGLGVSLLVLYLRPPVAYSISVAQAANDAAAVAPNISYGAQPALSDPKYYSSMKQTLTSQKTSFIDADLASMTLSVYVSGVLQLSVPILAKGEAGSLWETPAGIYQIQSKEEDRSSSLDGVNMPYSLDFQGNFFIHGWPTYPDGTPVSSSYSGGCIRLSTDDAQKVYALAQTGEPVVVYNETPHALPFSYTLKAPPSLSADEYLVEDLDTGTVLAQKNASTQEPIASITKLVTALVASEHIGLDQEVTVPAGALVYTIVPRLKAGQRVRAYDLLFLLLQESSNETAETLAADVGRDQFISDMNKKAQIIGLGNTTFNDPSGIKDDISTATDLFKLLRYIYDNRRFVFDITTGNLTDSSYGKPAFGTLNNFNIIKNVRQSASAPWATLLGGKVGETNQAGETYAGIFDVQLGDTDRKLAVIVLGSKDSPADVAKLLTFVHNSYAPAQ